VPGGRARRVPVVGLTGGLGAGKSTALALLGEMDVATLSTDSVVHQLYETDAVRAAVIEKFGDEIAPDGVIDRSAVATKVFLDSDDRHWIEQLLWPLVGARVQEFCRAALARDPRPRAIVIETPLLFEAGLESNYDATVAIVVEEGLRTARANSRGQTAVSERASRQLSQAEKASRATYTLRNDGSVEELKTALADLLAKLEDSVR
jgi:dephospho-CoA kinase